eukprot:14676110-Alexandrium_andersonii.AAC.1
MYGGDGADLLGAGAAGAANAAGFMPPVVEERVERITLPMLPEDFAGYEMWRFQVRTVILAAAPDPVDALQYLREADDPEYDFGMLAAGLPTSLNKVDVRLFSALVNALCGKKASRYLERVRSACAFGCGRQALRVLDIMHRREEGQLAIRAASQIVGLTCSGIGDLERYTQDFLRYKYEMGSGEHKLADSMGLELIRKQLKD